MSNTPTANGFYEACESGKGWDGCAAFCTADATFTCQAGSIGSMTTVQAYADWMKGMTATMPDSGYALKGLAEDTERGCVLAFGVFTGTHTAPGGPVEPTGKATDTQYVFIMQFTDGKISHITKVWNDAFAMGQLGWM
jgi:ketosteroid isomerase-like protein